MSELRWAVRPYRASFVRPLATARGVWTAREGFWVACEDDDGVVGLGEVAPLPAWGTETLDLAGRALRDGQLDRLRTPAAYAGVETALLDYRSRRAGVPLAAFLASGDPASTVAVNALLGGDTPESLAAEARAAAEAGYTAFKLKIGAQPLARDVERVRAVRAAIGDGAELRLDANGGWSRQEAIAALGAFAPWRPAYVEQPVATEDLEGLVAVQEASGVRVAADEAVRSEASALRLLAAGVGLLVLKPLAIGGLEVAGAIARAAREVGADVVLTSVLDRGVGTAAVLHLAAALGPAPAAGLDVQGLFPGGPALFGLAPERGRLTVPTGPGLGLAVRAGELGDLWEDLSHDSISLR